MTACNNNVRGGKASRVITAALVATLSVGTPMAAIASTVSEGGIDMLATDAAAVAGAEVTYDKKSGTSFAYDGNEHAITPTAVTPVNSSAVDDLTLCPDTNTDRKQGEWYYYYVKIGSYTDANYTDVKYTDAKGKEQTVVGSVFKSDGEIAIPDEVGTYAVIVGQWGNGNWVSRVAKAGTFYITAQSPADAVLVEDGDAEDTTFTYDGKTETASDWLKKIDLAIGGVVVDAKEYDESLYVKGTSTSLSTEAIKPGTTYVYKATFKGDSPYTGQSIERDFTVEPMDLSKAVVVSKVVTNKAPNNKSTIDEIVSSVNGVDTFDSSDLTVTFVSAPNNSSVSGAYGKYTFTIEGTKDASGKENPYFTGSQKFEVVYAKTEAEFNFAQCGDEDSDPKTDDTYVVDLSADKVKYFDITDLEVTNPASKYDYEDCDIAVYDKDGNKASLDDLKTPGEWTVKVSLYDDSDESNVIAGNDSCTVKVGYNEAVTAQANAFFAFDGKNVESATSAEYTGEDFLDKFSIVVKTDKRTFVEGTDYKVVVTNGEGKKVDSITEVGTYTITIDPVTFSISGDPKVQFTVNGVDGNYAKVNGTLTVPVYTTAGNVTTKTEKTFVPYTGDVINPTFSFYKYEEGKTTASDNDKLVDVPASAYKVTYTYSEDDSKPYTKADEVKAAGFYKATIADADNDDNYSISSKEVKFEVAKNTIFADVANDAWYAQSVIDAKDLGYMTGYAGTQIFGPTESLTRAQAVVVLYNMASGRSNDIAPDASYNKNNVYTTGFSDVDSDGANAWATYAIKWAKDTGITTGYGDGTFGVNDEITRAQFATMLARYAQLVNRYEGVEDADAVLGNYTDAASVDEWFKDSVAWAVSEGVMGQNVAELNPNGSIERAQVAAMAVRFQPEAL